MSSTTGFDYTGMDPGVNTPNQTIIFPNSDHVAGAGSPDFDFYYEVVCAGLFWILFLAHGLLGLSHVLRGNASRLKRWPIYLMLFGYIIVTCICESIALGYTIAANSGKESEVTYCAYIFFWHLSSASFLLLLLALSSGYCITRGTLEGERGKVLFIPVVVFVAGVASDWTFVYVESTQKLSAAAERYSIVEMSTVEQIVWFFGSLANIMAFILCWLFIFDSTQLEIKALDDAQEALLGKQKQEDNEHQRENETPEAFRRRRDRQEADTDDEDEAPIMRPGMQPVPQPRPTGFPSARLTAASQRAGLLYGVEDSAAATRGDEESGEAPATVADHMQYTVRKRLLSLFFIGVCTYLAASMAVILLPAFFVDVVQNALVVLQFAVKLLFTVMLAWTFRPGEDSPYLQIGRSDADADDRAELNLDTEMTVTEHTVTPAPGPSSAATSQNGHASTGNSAAGKPTKAKKGGPAAGFGPGNLPSSLPSSTPAGSGQRSRAGGYSSVTGQVDSQPQPQPRFTLGDEE